MRRNDTIKLALLIAVLCCAAQAIPYAMLAAGVLTFCGLNYSHYGVFALSDFSEGSFAAAMGAMMRVDTDSDKPYLSVPADARAKIYAAVPELEPLAYWLEEDDQLQNDFRDPGLDDYRAGSFTGPSAAPRSLRHLCRRPDSGRLLADRGRQDQRRL